MADHAVPPASRQSQIRLVAVLLGGMSVLVIGGYFLFARMQTVPLYEGLGTPEAAALVDELEALGVAYTLSEGGTAIRVSKSEADGVRLSLAGRLSPARGLDGFELFNESDMGLTEFAQRIKYQRALQGELARSILMIEGVERARVHIALPERSMFRSGQSRPTAAVTLFLAAAPEAATIAGIQHMVAASIPDLLKSDVVVLDQAGRLLSHPAPFVAGDVIPADNAPVPALMAGEGKPIRPEGEAAGIEAALRAILPDPAVTILVSQSASPPTDEESVAGRHILIVSDTALSETARLAIDRALAVGAPAGDGDAVPDRLEFLVRAQPPPAEVATEPAPVIMSALYPSPPDDWIDPAAFVRRHGAQLAGGGVLLLVTVILLLLLRRRRGARADEPAAFAAQLKAELDRQSGLVGR